MSKILNFEKIFNQACRRPTEQPKTLKLFIATSRQGDSYGVAIKVVNFRQIVHRDFRLLRPNEAESDCRAFWAGYELARRWTDLHTPQARLYLADASPARNHNHRRAA